MTREEKQKAIDVLKISAPVMAVTQEEFSDYIQTLNKIMDWLEQEPTTKNNLEVDRVKAVPYCEIAKSILQIRSINPRFDYIPRKEVIEILWRLIDGNQISKESLL